MEATCQVLKFAKDVIGKQGPIIVNSGVQTHLRGLVKNLDSDNIIVGKADVPITIDDIYKLIQKVQKAYDKCAFGNAGPDPDYTYTFIFEGIRKERGQTFEYSFSWGT